MFNQKRKDTKDIKQVKATSNSQDNSFNNCDGNKSINLNFLIMNNSKIV
jgi:hypothetical protein